MIKTLGKKSVSGLFFGAFVMTSLSIVFTILSNRDIEQSRLVVPVQTIGTLVSSSCTTFIRGSSRSGPQPYAVLKYKYSTIDTNPTQHVLDTTKWFDTLEHCAVFEKSNSNAVTLWYEKEHPEKASLYKTESYSWGGGLFGLILAALLVLFGVYDQKSINQEKRDAQKNRTSNKLKSERRP